MCKNDRTGTCLGLEFHHPTLEKGTPINSLKWLDHHHSSMEKLFALRRPDTQLKPHLLLVSFYFVLAQFHINKSRFSLVFPTYVQFCTKLLVLSFLEPFRKPTFLADLKKLSHILSSSLSAVFQVTNNQSISKIDKSFNIRQTKSWFLNHHQMIKLPSDSSM